MTRTLVFLVLTAGFAAGRAHGADKPIALDVWPGTPPGETKATGQEKDTTGPEGGLVAGKRVIRLTNVSKPTLTVYRPAKEKATGTAVVVCPGGGYHILAMDLEGTEVCHWLNELGVTAVLLKYRVPAPDRTGPLQDAQRAVSLVRARAKEWDVDPKRIGILGFSAGGHVAARTAIGFAKRAYEAVDKTDEASCRPDFAVLVYPAYLLNKKKDGLLADLPVTKETPPTFLAHAADDPVPAEGSVQLFLALRRAKVPAELHVYVSGGHGYGLRKTDRPCTTWPERCADWLRARGLLKR
jgi:acetyl esterase/lipase